jgi:S1-C subfamily serine protease
VIDKQVVILGRSNILERFASQVNAREHLIPRLSILALPLDASTAAFFAVSPRRTYGVLVARLAVTTNGPTGELLPGDILYAVNTEKVSTLPELRALMEKRKPGESVALQVERAGKIRYIEMRLE